MSPPPRPTLASLPSTSSANSFLIDPLSPPATPAANNQTQTQSFRFPILKEAGGGGDGGELGLADRLRNTTAKAHYEVMQPKVVGKLMSGKLPSRIHFIYLTQLHQIYTTLEHALSLHPSHPTLSLVYNPTLLSRSEALAADCSYFSDGKWDGKVEKGGDALREYVERLRELGEQSSESSIGLLLAHAYVRYLGDLSGGQSIARTLRKSYSLPSSLGSSFYNFHLPPHGLPFLPTSSSISTLATPDEVKAIKQWFREQLDCAGEIMSEEERVGVLEEARKAYKFNMGVFTAFEGIVDDYEQSQDQQAEGEREDKEEKERSLDSSMSTIRTKKQKMDSQNWSNQQTSVSTWGAVVLALLLGIYVIGREWGVSPILA